MDAGWEFVDRGMGRTVVCFAGFAFDGRIFAELDLPCDYLLPGSFTSPAPRPDQLPPQATFVLGWSLGASAALRFVAAAGLEVQHTWLVALRPQFPANEIAGQRAAVEADHEAYLRDFYRRAFAGQAADRRKFEAALLPDYRQRFSPQELLEGLDALAQLNVQPEEVDAVRATLVHGRRDLIAPLAEIETFAARCRRTQLEVLSDVGHVPLTSPQFRELLLRDLQP